jgi:molecular chaperone HtpG
MVLFSSTHEEAGGAPEAQPAWKQDEEHMAEQHETTKHEFKAETRKLLDILVHSLYSHKEIFLRELISNSSDALDKLRFETSRGSDVVDGEQELEIHIEVDKDQGLLRIKDSGIGLTPEELIRDIGTIARSGSENFLKAAAENKEGLEGIIGKFGVGFYSVFMVAKEVVITSRSFRPDEAAVQWKSDGLGSYEIGPVPEESTPQRGTTVEVHLRDEAKEFAEDWRIKDIIRKHSGFISFPIFVGDERINTITALWRESKSSITDEKYKEFYTFLTHDDQDPLTRLHISVDAPIQYNALLFVPERGVEWMGFQQERPGLDLYIRRVLIQRENKDLIPDYLAFCRGVVDSEDLPLNISRETLQENRNLQKISSNITKQLLSHLQRLAKDDAEKYGKFWKAHGKIFKLGYTDFTNREKYASLLRFNSSKCDQAEELTSLDEYIERAREDHKKIYYASGASREALALNPHLDIFRAKGIEVLYLFEPLDEFALEGLREYKEFNFQSVELADAKELEQYENQEEEKEAAPLTSKDEQAFPKLLARIKEILGDRITYVKESSRLKESPCCLVSPDGQLTSSMHRVMQIAGQDTSIPVKVLEVNKDHELVRNLIKIYRANGNDEYLVTAVEQLFESALLLDGYLSDPHALVERMQKVLHQSSGWYVAVKDIRD